jgi:hypothetical protein
MDILVVKKRKGEKSMSDDLKILKPRIPLKTVFRTTPSERRSYVEGVRKYNRDIREQARQKALAKAEQDKFLRDFNKSISDFEKASKIETKYYYEPAPVIPVEKTTSQTSAPRSTSRSSGGSRISPVSSIISMKTGKITATVPRKTTTPKTTSKTTYSGGLVTSSVIKPRITKSGTINFSLFR